MAIASKRLGRFTADDGVDPSLIGQLKFQVVDIPEYVHDFTGILLIVCPILQLSDSISSNFYSRLPLASLMMIKSTKRFFKTVVRQR